MELLDISEHLREEEKKLTTGKRKTIFSLWSSNGQDSSVINHVFHSGMSKPSKTIS